MEWYHLNMDFHKIYITACLFLCHVSNCRSISVNGDSQLVRPRVRRYLTNETDSSDGSNISETTLATNTSEIDEDKIEQHILTTLQTTESRSTSSEQKSENYTQRNISDIKQVTENVSSSDISDLEKVASSPVTIDITPKPNILDHEVTKQSKNVEYTEYLPTKSSDIESYVNITKQSKNVKYTEYLPTKSSDIESSMNITTTVIAASNQMFKGNNTETSTDTNDIKPIDRSPNEKKDSDIADKLEENQESYMESTNEIFTTDTTKAKQTTSTKIKTTVLNTTALTTPIYHRDFGKTSNSQPVVIERDTNNQLFAGKRTALSNGKDTSANIADENVKSTTVSLLDLRVNNTSDFSTTSMTTNPALIKNASSTKPEPKVKTTTTDSNVRTDVSSTSDTYRKTTWSETNKNTDPTSQSVTSDSKSKVLPVSKPGVTTLSTTVLKTGVITQITGVTTPKTAEASTEKNGRTTVSRTFAPTTDKEKGTIDRAEDLVKRGSNESMFGKYGLAMFIAACAVILCLLLVIIYLALNKKRKRNEEDFMVANSVPKLKMLEVRNSTLPGELKPGTAGKEDDLPTYSLDYEKHVQEKIEEHRKLAKTKSQNAALPGAEPTPLAGVTSFKIERRPSAASGTKRSSQKSRSGSQSGPTSPATPIYPEGRPLLDKEEEPVVFNFAKKPGEATAAREARQARRGSAPNAGNKMKSVTKSKDDYFGVNV